MLFNEISTELYQNFMLLSVGIRILLNPNLTNQYTDYAHQLFVCFVKHYSELFGSHQVVYNIHGLVHLAEDVRNHGSLDRISGFPFDFFLGSLKRLVRKPNHAIEQAIRRLSEKSNMPPMKFPVAPYTLKQQHSNGPFPAGNAFTPCSQYGLVHMNRFVIATSRGDNCILVGSEICVVKNIIQCESGVYFVYTIFKQSESLFDYPLDSRQLTIYKVSNLHDHLHLAPIESIMGKYVLLRI